VCVYIEKGIICTETLNENCRPLTTEAGDLNWMKVWEIGEGAGIRESLNIH